MFCEFIEVVCVSVLGVKIELLIFIDFFVICILLLIFVYRVYFWLLYVLRVKDIM